MGINKQKYFNYVKEFFTKYECELLTTFGNFIDRNENNLTFKCSCGSIENGISFKWYSRTVHKCCKACQRQNHSSRNNEYEKMAKFFESNDCVLLTKMKEYTNQFTKNLSYQCKCKNIVHNESYQLYYLSTYKCCHDCKSSLMDRRYTPFKDVKLVFDNANVELLTTETEYKGGSQTVTSKLHNITYLLLKIN